MDASNARKIVEVVKIIQEGVWGALRGMRSRKDRLAVPRLSEGVERRNQC